MNTTSSRCKSGRCGTRHQRGHGGPAFDKTVKNRLKAAMKTSHISPPVARQRIKELADCMVVDFDERRFSLMLQHLAAIAAVAKHCALTSGEPALVASLTESVSPASDHEADE